MRTAFLAAGILLASTIGVRAADSPQVDPGWDSGAVMGAALRCRNFNNGSGGEIYLGQAGLGGGGARVENDFYRGATCDGDNPYGSWQASNRVVFEYDPVVGKVYSTVTASADYCLEYTVGDLGPLNYVQLTVVNRAAGTSVSFENVTVDAGDGPFPLGDFVAIGWNDWMVTGIDLTDGFIIEGDLVLGGTQPNGETNKLQLAVGFVSTPRYEKEGVLAELVGTASTGDKKADRSLAKALGELEKSLDEHSWVDDSHLTDRGANVFAKEKVAVAQLMKVVGVLPGAQAWIDALVGVDRALAQVALEEAVAADGDASLIAKSQAALEKGDLQAADGKSDRAINEYKRAWQYATQAY